MLMIVVYVSRNARLQFHPFSLLVQASSEVEDDTVRSLDDFNVTQPPLALFLQSFIFWLP